MFLVKTKELSNIRLHYCYSRDVCDLVYNYIVGKYNAELIIEEFDGLPYFDPGGCRLIDPFLKDVELKNIECRIDDVGLLEEIINNYNFEYSKGFCRINSFIGNLCYSENEINEIKKYFRQNKYIKFIKDDVEKFYNERFKKK